jgi:outer membrane lipoprotein carrier protein
MRSLVIAAILSLAVPGATKDAAAVARAVEAHYARAGTLKAVFYQRYRSGNQGGGAESGTVYFSKPGRMRWEYESPSKKLFLVDGANVWFYVPADRTVSRAALKESADWRTPLALLTGKLHLNRLCGRLELVNPNEPDNAAGAAHAAANSDAALDPRDQVLRCSPGKHAESESASAQNGGEPPAFREILFEVDPENRLARVIVREPGDTETEFRFGHWQEQLSIPEAEFHFTPPPDVAVVNEEDLAKQVH